LIIDSLTNHHTHLVAHNNHTHLVEHNHTRF
jgi:hypothetical protein